MQIITTGKELAKAENQIKTLKMTIKLMGESLSQICMMNKQKLIKSYKAKAKRKVR